MSKQTKRILALAGMALLVVTLAGCSTAPVTSHSTSIWDHYVIYNAARFIIWLSDLLGGNYGVGIIAFTLIIRIIIFPLNAISMKSMTKQSELAPEIKKLQAKYSAKDTATQQKLQDETQKLYSKAGVNPVMGCLPTLIQMPFLLALYQAIYRTDALKAGSFLWMQLGKPDPYFITMILAALLTGLTSYLSMLAQPVKSTMNWAMVAIMPVFIFIVSMNLPSAVTIYWVVTNAFSVVQQLILQNPTKLRREREAKIQEEKDKEKALRKARKRALNRK